MPVRKENLSQINNGNKQVIAYTYKQNQAEQCY